ncbi:MAG TPA: apolipoprotein N-acyltransferase [Methylomirabilota bacterium]|nr:apolipoprotein N-acyltransferase [Methylomirabilota bacterium]
MPRALPWILAALAGLVFALAMPGPGLWPLALLAPGLLLEAVERGGDRWRPWLLGWLAGVVHWAVATNWVLDVMHHYGGLALWAAVLSLLAMAVILGAAWAVVAGIVARVGPPWRVWLLPALWVAVDVLRRLPPIQFPWNDPAAVLSSLPALLGSLPVWGATGLSWALLAIGAAAWGLVRRDRRPAAAALAIAAVGLAVAFTALASVPLDAGPPVRVAVLQPGTSLEEKWDPSQWREISDRVWTLTRRAADAGAELVLWPESAVPFRLDADPAYRDLVTGLARELGVEIILNSVAAVDGGFANSAFLVTGDGVAARRYDKVHLVPFGEYVPAWAELVIADALVREVGRFTPGRSVEPLLARVPAGVAVCYEVVFPGHSVEAVRAGAELMTTLTNDGWYGFSWAPVQHFAQVKLRAAEVRRFWARAALTGISGFVDPSGRVLASLGVGEQGLLVADLAPISGLTVRARWGDWWAWLCAAGSVALLVAGRKRRPRGAVCT